MAICQRQGEGITNYIRLFSEIAVDCHEHTTETHLVDICIAWMERHYCYALENLEIESFAKLEAKARRTSTSAPGNCHENDQLWEQNTRMHQVSTVTTDQRRNQDKTDKPEGKRFK
ncbi:hypothetical protein BVC80_1679g30 [Macleaya cordata]|uniref:Retrotransposon gag domain-containing protein n=1 Tax=Macleaya cordata TaxID=56857 RepID=A0A200Q0T7_MACCD|nr:hypothetical protein BVC80_1679g30 [Macleaya cordata]